MDELVARVEGLETRLRILEDERAIRELIGRYGWEADHGSPQDWVALFTSDGAITVDVDPGGHPGYSQPRSWQGPAELVRFITDPAVHLALRDHSHHMQGNNLVVRLKGNQAEAQSYSLVALKEPEGTVIHSVSTSRWRLQREGGAWRIAERIVTNRR